jgi:putative methyltransferase (TIGR04325 family)
MRFRRIIKQITPPVVIQLTRSLIEEINQNGPEWEYISDNWENSTVKGWNTQSILDVYKEKWPKYASSIIRPNPLRASHESDLSSQNDIAYHNAAMCFAYALTLASRNKSSISVLDWGGGIGHYYLLMQSLIPELEILYHCKDVPVLANYGKSLFPEARFYDDDTCFDRTYDFVFASTSLHYSQHWQTTLQNLANATTGYLFVTGLPIVQNSNSFIFVQRPYKYGYNTEYTGWCLNRSQFLQVADAAGIVLEREFIIGYQPIIKKAPEQNEYRGYLFQPRTSAQNCNY